MDEYLEAKREQEWRTFELYEKVRVRERRKKMILTLLAALSFLVLCSVTIVEERLPKWKTLHAAQTLSIEIEKLKLLSIQHQRAAQLAFLENGDYQVTLLDHCETSGLAESTQPLLGPLTEAAMSAKKKEPMKTEVLEQTHWDPGEHELKILNLLDANRFNVKLATDQICFDPVKGAEVIKSKKVVVIAPVKDLSENRLDRASYIIIESNSAKISIN